MKDVRVADLDSLSEGLVESYDLIPAAELVALDKVWLDVVTIAGHRMMERLRVNNHKIPTRMGFQLGDSDVAVGWTDGENYIALDRKYLKGLEMDVDGFIEVGTTVLHEICHHEPSTGAHEHDEQFYREFHDRVGVALGVFVRVCLYNFPKMLENAGRRATKRQLRDQDAIEGGVERMAAGARVLEAA
jgi:hypothetical protein